MGRSFGSNSNLSNGNDVLSREYVRSDSGAWCVCVCVCAVNDKQQIKYIMLSLKYAKSGFNYRYLIRWPNIMKTTIATKKYKLLCRFFRVIWFNRFTKTVTPIYSYLTDDNLHVILDQHTLLYVPIDTPNKSTKPNTFPLDLNIL